MLKFDLPNSEYTPSFGNENKQGSFWMKIMLSLFYCLLCPVRALKKMETFSVGGGGGGVLELGNPGRRGI